MCLADEPIYSQRAWVLQSGCGVFSSASPRSTAWDSVWAVYLPKKHEEGSWKKGEPVRVHCEQLLLWHPGLISSGSLWKQWGIGLRGIWPKEWGGQGGYTGWFPPAINWKLLPGELTLAFLSCPAHGPRFLQTEKTIREICKCLRKRPPAWMETECPEIWARQLVIMSYQCVSDFRLPSGKWWLWTDCTRASLGFVWQ